jgi:hypothetical protein
LNTAACPPVRPNRIEAAIVAASQRKENNMSNTTHSKPTHRAYAVTTKDERKFWREIGALWAHSDGEGFTLKLDLLPLNPGRPFFVRARRKTRKSEEGGAEVGATSK